MSDPQQERRRERARKRPALFAHMQVGDVRKVPYDNPVLGPVKLYRAATLCGLDITSTATTRREDKVTCPFCKELM